MWRTSKQYLSEGVIPVPLVLLLLFGFLPLIIVSRYSFAEWNPIIGRFQGWRSLEGYRLAFSAGRTMSLGRISVRGMIISTIDVLLAVPVAYVMVRRLGPVLRATCLIAFTLPLLTCGVTRAFSWRLILGREGLIDHARDFLFPKSSPLTWIIFSETGVGIALVSGTVAFAIFSIVLSLSTVPDSVWLASEETGAKLYREFFLVVLPLAKQGILVAWLGSFFLIIGSSVEASFVGTPSQSTIGQVVSGLETSSQLSAICALTCVLTALLSFAGFIIYLTYRWKAKRTIVRAN
jgi:ABC-type spermidine/putrescine transport system permease subunit I